MFDTAWMIRNQKLDDPRPKVEVRLAEERKSMKQFLIVFC